MRFCEYDNDVVDDLQRKLERMFLISKLPNNVNDRQFNQSGNCLGVELDLLNIQQKQFKNSIIHKLKLMETKRKIPVIVPMLMFLIASVHSQYLTTQQVTMPQVNTQSLVFMDGQVQLFSEFVTADLFQKSDSLIQSVIGSNNFGCSSKSYFVTKAIDIIAAKMENYALKMQDLGGSSEFLAETKADYLDLKSILLKLQTNFDINRIENEIQVTKANTQKLTQTYKSSINECNSYLLQAPPSPYSSSPEYVTILEPSSSQSMSQPVLSYLSSVLEKSSTLKQSLLTSQIISLMSSPSSSLKKQAQQYINKSTQNSLKLKQKQLQADQLVSRLATVRQPVVKFDGDIAKLEKEIFGNEANADREGLRVLNQKLGEAAKRVDKKVEELMATCYYYLKEIF